jgi:hypothetical protein
MGFPPDPGYLKSYANCYCQIVVLLRAFVPAATLFIRPDFIMFFGPPVLRPKRLFILTNHQVRLIRGLDALPHPR